MIKAEKQVLRRAAGLAIFLMITLGCTLALPFPTPTPTLPTPTEITPTEITPTLPTGSLEALLPVHPWEDRTIFEAGLVPAARWALDSTPGATIYHIGLFIPEAMTSLSGMEQVRYTNTETVPLAEVHFGLFPEVLGGAIAISSVTVDGTAVTPVRATGRMQVPLQPALAPGTAVTIQIEFTVTIPTQGGSYYYGIFGYNEQILSLAHAYPTVLVYNAEGWNSQAPDTDGDPLFADASYYLVNVDAPADLVMVASGREVERSAVGGRQRVLYANGPGRDFYLAAREDLVSHTARWQETTIHAYALAERPQGAQATAEMAVDALRIFSQRFGPYPYAEFDIVPITTSAGGVEYPGMTAIGAFFSSDDPFLEIVIAHEIGHQWFYNLVGNDTQDEPWLDESLTQYVTCLYFLDRYGQESMDHCIATLRSLGQTASQPEIPIGLPVSSYSSNDYASIIYGRGGLFFIALNDEMGADNFSAFLREYVRRYSWDVASTEDFRTLAEQECSCDLTGLFDEWVYP
ncbi:MAG: M1 family metallopeptidase [Chloroflexota bacterium]